jgi:hypothetical protein
VLTIFTCLKPFKGHINIIQRNAINSWTLLQPRPDIILIGDEEGTVEICKEFGLRHILEVERNEYGTPLVSSIFEIGQSEALNTLVCYVNADIILVNDFIGAIKLIIRNEPQQKAFLMVGRRWSVDLNNFCDFENDNWEPRLKDYVINHGNFGPVVGIDYFLFPRGLWEEIPPFALGRSRWDNWFIYEAHRKRIPVIDVTQITTVVHQNHDYSHIKQGAEMWLKRGPEAEKNLRLRGGFLRMYTIWDADLIATPGGLEKVSIIRHIGAHLLRIKGLFAYTLTHTLYPYSYPLILLLKGVRRVLRTIILAFKALKFR